jgi:hypothetical protein
MIHNIETKGNKMNENTVEAEIIEENQIVLSEIKYPVSANDLESLLIEYQEVPDIDPDAEDEIVGEQYQFVLKGHKAFVKARTGIEKTRKSLKQPALEYGKKVDDIAKEFQSMIKTKENYLFVQRKRVEDNEARKQREVEEIEELRIDTIKSKMTELQMLPLKFTYSNSNDIQDALNDMEYPTIDVFDEFLEAVINIYNLSSTQLKQMFDDKILIENAQKIKDEADAKVREDKAREDKKLQDEKEELAKQHAVFQKQKDDFAQQQRLQQEDIDRQKAEQKADELLRRQEDEAKANLKIIEDFKYPNEMYIVVSPDMFDGTPKALAYESQSITLEEAKEFQKRVNKNSKIYKAVEVI